MAFSSPLNTFTTSWPLYTSSTVPFKVPKYSCCLTKCFCDFLTINPIIPSDNGIIRRAAIVIVTLMESIIIKIPINVITDVTIWLKLWLKFCDKVSTSLVTQESISPCVFLSKNFIGSLFIFIDISFLNL